MNTFSRYTWLLLLFLLCGCGTVFKQRELHPNPRYLEDRTLKPVIVLNPCSSIVLFKGSWALGSSMTQQLEKKLMKRGDVTVLEQRDTQRVLADLFAKGRKWMRKQEVVDDHCPEARYLVETTLTEFTVEGDESGWFGEPSSPGMFRGAKAYVSMDVRVTDTATGK